MKTNDSPLKPLSLDALGEDLLGLSFKGLHSVRVLWIRPRTYFDAAKVFDWTGAFTPSIRLWLSFFALFSALKFWWLGSNEGMITAYAEGFAQAGLVLPQDLTYREVGREAVLFVFGLVPALHITTMVALSLIYPFWGEPTTMALRQRYFFAIVIPGASIMPVFLTAMMIVPSAWLTAYGIFLAVLTLAIDFLTGIRGGFASVSGFQRIWRAGLLAFIVVTLNVTTSIIAQIAGIILTNQKYSALAAG